MIINITWMGFKLEDAPGLEVGEDVFYVVNTLCPDGNNPLIGPLTSNQVEEKRRQYETLKQMDRFLRDKQFLVYRLCRVK